MLRVYLGCLLALVLSVGVSFAQDTTITRRDGFLMIWKSINRPADKTREQLYNDVAKGSRGELAITYAKHRGLLDTVPSFYPDQSLTLKDALVWLFRTRNIRKWDQMNIEHLEELVRRYPIVRLAELGQNDTLTTSELQILIERLDDKLDREVHGVSFYADDFQGKGTAFGETFDMHALTAAHRTLPHNTLLKVTNIENGKSVVVRINDRGPYVAGRSLDLSLASFEAIANRSRGHIQATFERLGHVDYVDLPTDDTAEKLVEERADTTSACIRYTHHQRRITRDVLFETGVPHKHVVNRPLILRANRTFIVHQVADPFGNVDRQTFWVASGEEFTFTPRKVGTYRFIIGTADGRRREMRMQTIRC